MTNKVFQVTIGNDADGKLRKCDGIEFEGKLWLVPRWLEILELRVSTPARIIRFDDLSFQKTKHGSNFGDYFLTVPVPKALLDPTPPPKQAYGFEYVEAPDIQIPDSVRPLKNLRNPGLN